MFSHISDSYPISVTLEIHLELFSFDSLMNLYCSNNSIRDTLNSKHILIKLAQNFRLNKKDTFPLLFEEAKVNFLSIESLKLHSLDTCVLRFAKKGSLELVKYCVEKGANNYEGIAKSGARANSLEIVKYSVEKGANNYDEIAYYGASANSLEIVKYSVEKGANDYDEIAKSGARAGSLEIVKYCVERGADSEELKKVINNYY